MIQVHEEFRYLQRKRKFVAQDLHAVRMKVRKSKSHQCFAYLSLNQELSLCLQNIRWISELTKFNLVPAHLILHIIKVCIDDLHGTNVENLCDLLEGCGRWVLNNAETRQKMTQLVGIKLFGLLSASRHRRLVTESFLCSTNFKVRSNEAEKSVAKLGFPSDNVTWKRVFPGWFQFLGLEEVILLIYYYPPQCNPPDRPIIEPKHRTPMELFIRYKLYDCLCKTSVDRTIKTLRKLHWNDPEVRLKFTGLSLTFFYGEHPIKPYLLITESWTFVLVYSDFRSFDCWRTSWLRSGRSNLATSTYLLLSSMIFRDSIRILPSQLSTKFWKTSATVWRWDELPEQLFFYLRLSWLDIAFCRLSS